MEFAYSVLLFIKIDARLFIIYYSIFLNDICC